MIKKDMNLLDDECVKKVVDSITLLHSHHHRLTRFLIGQDSDTKIDGVQCWLPYNVLGNRLYALATILDNLLLEYRKKTKQKKRPPIFTDLGSGTGNILTLAKAMGYLSRGLEYQEPLVRYVNMVAVSYAYDLAERFTGRNDYIDFFDSDPVKQGNLLKEEDIKNHLVDKDVIYSYNPIKDPDAMEGVLRCIIKHMKPGATFIYLPAATSLKDVIPSSEISKEYDYFQIYKKPVVKCKSK